MILVMVFQIEGINKDSTITVENGWKGWLEDRRPASNGDPYKIAGRIVETVKTANI